MMQLQTATWPEIQAYLERTRTVVLPIGSTEQHGPIGLIGTDALLAAAVANSAAEADDFLVAPVLPIGMAQHHIDFPGSITLRPTTLIRLIDDVVCSLLRHGFERFYFVNGHGGNTATLNAAFAEVYSARLLAGDSAGAIRFRLCNWWAMPEWHKNVQRLFGDQDGMHATPSEISLTQHLFPHTIRGAHLEPHLAPSESDWGDGTRFRVQFPDGRVGSASSLANPRAGGELFAVATAEVAGDLRVFAAA